ncbi:META domain-containing protein [Helicobacter sp. 23-1045]
MTKNIFIAIILSAVFIACARQNIALPNAKYNITAISLNDILLESPKGAHFSVKDSEIFGKAGCNNYFTSFAWVDENIIEISANGGSTRMMCAQAEMEFERIFLQNLAGKFNVANVKNAIILDNGHFTITLQR